MTSPAAAKTFYDFSAHSLIGAELIDFARFRGKPVVVVNGASQCGYTKSGYSGLAKLLDAYHRDGQGLHVVVFPCNQFMGQESGAPEEIACTIEQYDPRFVVTNKVDVNGRKAAPVWTWLKEQCPGTLFSAIKWNFTKFVIDRRGRAVARFGPNDDPSSMVPVIERVMAESV
jgi:glutathione peroxidase